MMHLDRGVYSTRKVEGMEALLSGYLWTRGVRNSESVCNSESACNYKLIPVVSELFVCGV